MTPERFEHLFTSVPAHHERKHKVQKKYSTKKATCNHSSYLQVVPSNHLVRVFVLGKQQLVTFISYVLATNVTITIMSKEFLDLWKLLHLLLFTVQKIQGRSIIIIKDFFQSIASCLWHKIQVLRFVVNSHKSSLFSNVFQMFIVFFLLSPSFFEIVR